MCHSRRKKKVREGKDVFITVSFVTIQVHGEQLQPINTQSLRIKVAKNAIDSKKETRPRRDSKSNALSTRQRDHYQIYFSNIIWISFAQNMVHCVIEDDKSSERRKRKTYFHHGFICEDRRSRVTTLNNKQPNDWG